MRGGDRTIAALFGEKRGTTDDLLRAQAGGQVAPLNWPRSFVSEFPQLVGFQSHVREDLPEGTYNEPWNLDGQ